MKDNYTKEDFKRGYWKDISDKFTPTQKIIMTIKAYLDAGQIVDRDELKKEIDAVFS